MIEHTETRYSPYSVQQLFSLVADVERYPEFLPWVSALRVKKRENHIIHAEMLAKFKAFSASYTSEVTLNPPRETGDKAEILVRLVEGPFKFLQNQWGFEKAPEGGTLIHFKISFSFSSRMLQKLMGMMFEKAFKRMVTCFEERAHQLYNESLSSTKTSPSSDSD